MIRLILFRLIIIRLQAYAREKACRGTNPRRGPSGYDHVERRAFQQPDDRAPTEHTCPTITGSGGPGRSPEPEAAKM
jgi:hypothetical protein